VTKPIEPEALVDAVGKVTGRFARRNAGE
jgi:hypothetical protein